eukprot:symbB.v1.2.009017.t1/scaffold564.1/size186654/11
MLILWNATFDGNPVPVGMSEGASQRAVDLHCAETPIYGFFVRSQCIASLYSMAPGMAQLKWTRSSATYGNLLTTPTQLATCADSSGSLEERLAARLPASRAERALEEITHGQAMLQKFQEQAEADEKSKELHGPTGIAQRKDGLDMSLQQLMSDGSRMRSQLNEIGLQLGRGGRDRALEHLKQNAVPRDLQEEFREQQKVLLEQKRILEQLRNERQMAAGDQNLGWKVFKFQSCNAAESQYWLHRKNRLDHEDNIVGKPGQTAGVDSAVPPEELLEAHQRMRANPEAERIYGWSDPQVAVPPQDGYAGVTLARSAADFPDEVGERCCPDYIHGVDLSYNLAAENERRTRAVAMRKRAPASAIKTREEIAVEEIQTSEPEPIRGGFFSGWEEPAQFRDEHDSRGAGSSSQWSSRRGDDDEYDLDSKPARDAARGFAERGVQHFTEADVSLTPRRNGYTPRGQRARPTTYQEVATSPAFGSGSHWHEAENPAAEESLSQPRERTKKKKKAARTGLASWTNKDVLELAARVAKLETLAPNLQQHDQAEIDGAKKTMTAYAALLLDSLQQYEDSSVLGLWIVEALTTLFRAGDADQQAEFSVPFFRAFVSVALRFQDANSPNLHMRVLQGLAEVASPDCRLCDPGLLDYVMDQLDQNRNKLNTLTTEHALAILCMLRSPHRVSEQLRHCLLILRGLKSEEHLCTRAMVTAAELYTVVDKLLAKEIHFDDHAQSAFVSELGIPQSGVDVRLVATVMDLYPQNRKLAGAATRAFSAMAKITSKHLQDIVSGEVRPDLISDGLIIMCCKSLRSSTRDAEILAHLLQSLEIFLKASASKKRSPKPVNLSLAQALPSDILVKIGETHLSDSRVITPLCSCIVMQATASEEYRDDFVSAGTIAIPLRVFDEAGGLDFCCYNQFGLT